MPALRVAVGGEAVEMRSWAGRGAYAALAGALGGGLAALAPHCAPLRHALELPAAPPPRAPPSRLDKLQRVIYLTIIIYTNIVKHKNYFVPTASHTIFLECI